MGLTRSQLAARIDHTLLAPETTPRQVVELCDQGLELAVHAVCVSASLVEFAAERLSGSEVCVAAVVGFPSGAHHCEVKRAEAGRAISDGASELDMVINLGLGKAGRWDEVSGEIAAVRSVVGNTIVLKVIIEAALWGPDEIVAACQASVLGGADYVKTSTGYHPAGGASPAHVELIAQAVGRQLGIKAAGGIRTAEDAVALIAAGATRLGMSRTREVLDGWAGLAA